jgi:uncharacterized protein YndB with AHSA1/START domain
VPAPHFSYTRVIDMPVSIVWIALMEPDLVSGWLAEAQIEPRVGGRFDLDWDPSTSIGRTSGRIDRLDTERLLVVDLAQLGRLSFSLQQIESGTRGTSTQLTVTLWSQPSQYPLAALAHRYLADFAQLDDLLHGHHRSQHPPEQHPAFPVETPRRLS